jgi:hypothetical protein
VCGGGGGGGAPPPPPPPPSSDLLEISDAGSNRVKILNEEH